MSELKDTKLGQWLSERGFESDWSQSMTKKDNRIEISVQVTSDGNYEIWAIVSYGGYYSHDSEFEVEVSTEQSVKEIVSSIRIS